MLSLLCTLISTVITLYLIAAGFVVALSWFLWLVVKIIGPASQGEIQQ